MSAVNAFNWKAYTDEEHAKHGDPFADIKRSAEISAATTAGVNKLRKKSPSHGTIFGVTDKNISTRAPDMMETKNAKRKNAARSQRAADRQ
jgi:hypothetical protein